MFITQAQACAEREVERTERNGERGGECALRRKLKNERKKLLT